MIPEVIVNISGNTWVPALQLICSPSDTLKNLPELAIDHSSNLYTNGKSLWLWHSNSNVSVVFIYMIDPTGFDHGILLMLVRICFTDFTGK